MVQTIVRFLRFLLKILQDVVIYNKAYHMTIWTYDSIPTYPYSMIIGENSIQNQKKHLKSLKPNWKRLVRNWSHYRNQNRHVSILMIMMMICSSTLVWQGSTSVVLLKILSGRSIWNFYMQIVAPRTKFLGCISYIELYQHS